MEAEALPRSQFPLPHEEHTDRERKGLLCSLHLLLTWLFGPTGVIQFIYTECRAQSIKMTGVVVSCHPLKYLIGQLPWPLFALPAPGVTPPLHISRT